MADINDLYQARAKVLTEKRAMIDKAEKENRDFDAVELDAEKKMDEEYNSLNARITRMEQDEKRRLDAARSDSGHREPGGGGQKDPAKELRARFSSALCADSKSREAEEYRALQADNPTQAGYLIAPQDFQSEIIRDVDNLVFIRNKARKFTLTKAASMGFLKRTARVSSYTRNSELGTPTADTTLAFGKREFFPRPANGEILVSRTLLRNASIGADQIVREELAYDMAIGQEQEFLTGSGANGQALGLFTASNDGIDTSRDVSTGNAQTAVTFDGLLGAKYALKQPYWAKAEWIFNRTVMLGIQKIKDGDGKYIYRESVRAGEPALLLDLPFNLSEYAPSTMTTGQYVGIVGDFSNYWIVDALTMEIQVLMELYARTNQVDYLYRVENDGQPSKAEAFARVKLA